MLDWIVRFWKLSLSLSLSSLSYFYCYFRSFQQGWMSRTNYRSLSLYVPKR
jgi:hypothetical protein